MRIWSRLLILFCGILLVATTGCRSASENSVARDPKKTSRLERVAVFAGEFVLSDSGRPFHPWGLNYGNRGRLIEDFWDTEWSTLESDFRKMKAMHANVVRVHLQFGKFMDGPDKPDEHALKQFARLLRLAEKTGLYLDITGLGSYRPADVPSWYDALDEQRRWAAQANFWAATANVGKSSTAIFCYDLMNEPFVAGAARKPGEWRSGHLLGSGKNAYDYIQFINLDAGTRQREEIAQQWIACMRTAIRQEDPAGLITVGQMPWSREWHHLSGFDPAKIKDELDFLSVHIYPDSKNLAEAMECLKQFEVGKPVVIEETFPLSCTMAQERDFLVASRAIATGWMGHFDGDSLAELDSLDHAHKISPVQTMYREWMQLFVSLGPELTGLNLEDGEME